MFKKILLGAMLICCASTSAFAKAHNVTVKLTDIEAVKVKEKHGDEIYFSITQYSNRTDPTILRVPMSPMHWSIADLSKVRDVILWQGKVEDDQSVLLILSLLEQDLPPWNSDEHIGSAELKILNKQGQISTTWGQPDFKDQPQVKQTGTKDPKYRMFGNNSEYVVQFKVVVE